MHILDKITQLREARRWMEYKFAEEADIAQSTISSWYKKGMLPTIPSMEKICDAFGITLSQFFAEDTLMALTEEQKELLDYWCRLNKNQQAAVIALLASFIS